MAARHNPGAPGQATAGGLSALADRVAALEALDAPAAKLFGAWRGALGDGALRDVLRGRPIGHAVHPLLTDLPIGMWTGALLLDLLGGRGAGPAAERLIAFGLVASAPTAVSGWSDWTDEHGNERIRRIGLVHGVTNGAAIARFAASLAARRRGRRARGRLRALAGLGTLGAGGWLGGHLAYVEGARVQAPEARSSTGREGAGAGPDRRRRAPRRRPGRGHGFGRQ
jgi:uncharacterized membrane protein